MNIKYWSSSPRIVTPKGVVSAPTHLVLVSVTEPGKAPRTARIATCPNSVVSQRIAQLLENAEGSKE